MSKYHKDKVTTERKPFTKEELDAYLKEKLPDFVPVLKDIRQKNNDYLKNWREEHPLYDKNRKHTEVNPDSLRKKWTKEEDDKLLGLMTMYIDAGHSEYQSRNRAASDLDRSRSAIDARLYKLTFRHIRKTPKCDCGSDYVSQLNGVRVCGNLHEEGVKIICIICNSEMIFKNGESVCLNCKGKQ